MLTSLLSFKKEQNQLKQLDYDVKHNYLKMEIFFALFQNEMKSNFIQGISKYL